MNRARKGSPRTFKMEPTGPKVPSRYLTGPTGSCHDNCKCETKPITETKPKNPSPKRTPKPPAPNSVPRINKPPAIIPKSTTTTRSFKNNNVVKDQTLKKDATNEPKKRDFKLKSVNSQAKTYNRPSSTTPSRRLSDICVPSKDMSLPSSRFPKRRLSEIIIHPKKDVASISNGSTGRGSGINKNESKKDSKLPLVKKKSNSLKTIVSTSKNNAKVSPLRTYKSLPKPEPKGPRKAKPIEELVHEKTLDVIEPNNDVEITKSQSQRSPNRSPSSSEVKAMKDDQNGVVESLPPSVEDDSLAKDGHTSSAEVDAMKDDQNEVVESSPPSSEDDQHEVVKTSPPLMKDDQNEVVESSPPSLEDDQHEVVNISPPSMEDDHNENEVVESSPPPPLEDDQHEAVKISPPSSEDDQNEVVEPSPPSMEDDTPAKDGQENDTIETTNVEKLEEETNDCSLDDLAFRRGTILSPEAENKGLIEMQFKKGKELENETEEGENISLRRLSSDGAVCIAESVTISVDLKHQETEEKKAAVLSNNVIEETASKLIRARKSKVKALVGAFETIVSSESPRK